MTERHMPEHTNGRRKNRVVRVAAAVAVAVAAGGAAVAAFGFDLTAIGGPDQAANTGAFATAEIVQRTLTRTETVGGDLGYGDAVGLDCLLQGTLTALPAPGDVLERGDELYRVDDAPVVLLYGALPAYRTLTTGTEGADVAQFERNLERLGYGGFTVDTEYTAKTAAAVKAWQDDLGLTASGEVELGRIAYAPNAIRVGTVEADLGDPSQGTVFTRTGLDKLVTVQVDLDHQELVVVGGPVAITLPDGTEATGTVTDSVSEVVPSDQGEEDRTVLAVTVVADDPAVFDGLDQASIDVGFPGDTAEDVLAVPVEALLGLAGGGYGLEIADGGDTTLVAVETGLFADGYVEVTGDGLAAGQSVVVPS